MQICLKCEKPFDGDECGGCVARRADIKKALFRSLLLVGAGSVVLMFAVELYAPLGWDLLVLSHSMDFLVIPGAIALLLVLGGQLEHYAVLVRSILVLASAAPFILAAFFFLNGNLDGNPPVEAQALVTSKYITHGKGASHGVVLSITWNQKRIEESIDSRETFSTVEPGDSVTLAVHPGAFSIPWYAGDLLSRGVRVNSR